MVKEVKIQGKVLFLAFNMNAIFAFQKATGKSLDALDNVMNDSEIFRELVYQGLKEGHRIKKLPFEMEKMDVLAIDFKELEQYTNAISESFNAAPVKKKTGKSKDVMKQLK